MVATQAMGLRVIFHLSVPRNEKWFFYHTCLGSAIILNFFIRVTPRIAAVLDWTGRCVWADRRCHFPVFSLCSVDRPYEWSSVGRPSLLRVCVRMWWTRDLVGLGSELCAGEFGMLNEPDCDIETRFSAQLLLVERSGDNMWPYDKLEKAWRTKLDNGQETAAALRRRIADLPVRIKAKNAEYGSAKAAAALAAASAKLKADKEKQEAAEKEKAAAAAKKAAEEKAAADAAAEEQLSAAEAAAKAAVERATAKKLAEAAAARAKAEEEAVAAQAASDSHTEL